MKLRTFEDPAELTQALAGLITQELTGPAPGAHPVALMLAGGQTPLAAYDRVAARPPHPDPRSHLLLSDERMVPRNSPRLNYAHIGLMCRAMRLPHARIMAVNTDLAPDAAARDYHQQLDRYLSAQGTVSVGILGLGSDGHTASLFTPAQLARGKEDYAIAVDRPDGLPGVSVTPAFLRRVDRLIFVAAGSSKSAMVRTLQHSPESITAGQAVAGHPRVELWADRAAT
jgi:6-phosphogluconolactonase